MLKKLFFFLFALGLLIGIGIAILIFSLNPILAKFKPQINEKISEAVGQEVRLGDVSAQLFPSIGVVVSDISAGSGSERSTINKLVLKAGIGDMFSGNISVSQFELDSGKIHLQRDANGALKVAGLEIGKSKNDTENIHAEDSNPDNSQPTPQKESVTSNDTKLEFQLKKAIFKDLNVFFQDKAAKPVQNLQLEDFNAEVRDIDLSGKGNFDARFSFLGKTKENFKLSGKLEGIPQGSFLPNGNSKLKIESINLGRLNKILMAYGKKPANLSLDKDISLDLDSTFSEGTPSLKLSVDGTASDISFDKSFKKPAGEKFALSLDSNIGLGSKPSVDVQALDLSLGNIKLKGSARIKNSSAENLKLKSNSLPLSELQKFVPLLAAFKLGGSTDFDLDINPGTKDKPHTIKGDGKLNNISLSSDVGGNELSVKNLNGLLNFNGDSLSTKSLTLDTMDHSFDVDATVKNFKSPSAKFALTSEKLELGKILAGLGKPNPNLEESFISNLSLSGNYGVKSESGKVLLTAGKSSVSKVPIDSINLKADISPKLIKIAPSSIKPFGGKLDLFGSLSRNNNPVIQANINGSNFDSAVIASTFMPDSKLSLSGIIESITASLSTRTDDLIPAASGSLKANVGKGEIVGINILGESLAGISGLPGLGSKLAKYVPEENQAILKAKNTAFNSLKFESNLEKGKLKLRTFSLNHDLYILDGDGFIGLVDGSKRIQARLRLTAKMAESMVERKPKLRLIQDRDGGIVVPILIKASAGGRTLVLPDTKDLIRRAGRNTAKDALSKELEKVAPGLCGAADALDGLFGGKRSKREPSSGESNTRRNNDSANDLGKAIEGAAGKALQGIFGR